MTRTPSRLLRRKHTICLRRISQPTKGVLNRLCGRTHLYEASEKYLITVFWMFRDFRFQFHFTGVLADIAGLETYSTWGGRSLENE